MLNNDTLESYNHSLLMKYGRQWDHPRYRVSFTSTAREFRWVEGTEYIGPIKLRDVKAIQEMAKYPQKDDRDKYVLEILLPIPLQLREELWGFNGNLTYEPLFIFKKKINGEVRAVDPTWPMVNILAYFSNLATSEQVSPELDQYKIDRKEYEEAMMMLDNELPDLAVSLRNGSSVSFGGVKAFVIN